MKHLIASLPIVSVALAISLFALILLSAQPLTAQTFACPTGTVDVMKYFALSAQKRPGQFMSGSPNPIYTEVAPNQDFATSGHWFWLKSPTAHGFDVKAFDTKYVYMRATELNWTDNTSFKRFVYDLPIAARCIPSGKPGPAIKVANTTFKYYQSCVAYKSSTLGTSVNTIDAPVLMNAGGNIGQIWTRVLHYHYDCNSSYQSCADEEQFYLGSGYGLWQWKHLRGGVLQQSALMNKLTAGTATGTLPCTDSYQ